MGVWEDYLTDEKKVDEGVWVNFQTYGFRVRRPTSKVARVRLQRLERAARGKNTDAEEFIATALSSAIVIDWYGITKRGSDEEIPFSQEDAHRLFKEMPELAVDVFDAANDRKLFLAEIEDAEKNS